MKPERKARQRIDLQLEQAGWAVQDYRQMNISASRGVAVREFPLATGDADYPLYVDAKSLGVIEAKPEGYTLTGVETQSGKYLTGLPKNLPAHRLPLPFAYETTGVETHFTNILDPDPRSREVFTFHRVEELLRLVNLEQQLRCALRAMPPINIERLWRVQIEAITNLAKSLAANRPRALIQMATGSGKTFTCVSFTHWLIKFAGAKRVLFLVDRTNLGEQALNEFQQFVSPTSGYKFTDEFNVQHLHSNSIDPVCRVCITTIQRLYSILRGEPEYAEENEEQSLFETESPLVKEALPVVYNPTIPIETFDFIVVDECHRSIYNLWRQVLEYFDSFLIGLTATPTKQTVAFFNSNLVMEYGHKEAVADHVNVGFDVYRIETKISRDGATLVGEPGKFIPTRDRRTREKRLTELEDDLTYTASQLDRDVVAENQIRLVVRTFRDRLFTEIFPGRTEVPKTLVFAKDDAHADDITRIIREEFGRGNDFCQKITYKTTGKKPKELLAEFRTMFYPRIAVTVDMIATGTDVNLMQQCDVHTLLRLPTGIDRFVFVTSDSDFSVIMDKLRIYGKQVWMVCRKTDQAKKILSCCCDRLLSLEESIPHPPAPPPKIDLEKDRLAERLFKEALHQVGIGNLPVKLSALGVQMRKLHQGFDFKSTRYKRLTDLAVHFENAGVARLRTNAHGVIQIEDADDSKLGDGDVPPAAAMIAGEED